MWATKRSVLAAALVLLLTLRSFGAVVYLRFSDGADGDSGATWALAKATLAAALTAAGAGGTVYVSDNHAETQASTMTLTSPGTAASPVRVICVDDTGDPEPPTARATTATVSTTGASNINPSTNNTYVYGIKFNVGDGANIAIFGSGGFSGWFFDTCEINLVATSSGYIFFNGVTPVALKNCTLSFSSASQGMYGRANPVMWTGGSITGTAPTTLFLAPSVGNVEAHLVGVDLSLLTSGKYIAAATSVNGVSRYQLLDCKLGSGVTLVNGAVANYGTFQLRAVNCDSGDPSTTGGIDSYQDYAGSWQTEYTISRTGGSSNGTVPISYKLISTANSKFYAPLYGPWMAFWNETTGSSVTPTCYIASFGTVKLQDDEVWIEVASMNTSGFPLATFTSDQVSDPIFLATVADQATDTSTWTATARQNTHAYALNDVMSVQGKIWICTDAGTSEGTEPAGYATANDGDTVTESSGDLDFRAAWRQKVSASPTPAEKGPIYARVVLAEPSTTVYADALVKP